MPIERPLLQRVVVRFMADVRVPYADDIGRQLDLIGARWSDLRQRFGRIRIRRLLRSVEPAILEERVRRAEAALSLPRRENALSDYVIECPDSVDPRELARELASWPSVETVYVDTVPKAPGNGGCSTNYLGSAAAVNGIDANFARLQAGGDGSGQHFVDLELAWAFGHSAYSRYAIARPRFGVMLNDAGAFVHGTSTLGVVCGDDGAGFTGVAPGTAPVKVVTDKRDKNSDEAESTIPDAIAKAVDDLLPLGGGVLLLEVESHAFLPIETNSACFQAIQTAVGNGIVVIEPSGNNGVDLDNSPLVRDDNNQPYLSRNASAGVFQDSGAVMVASSDHAAVGLTRRPNANFGTRIDCYAWGDGVETSVANGPGPAAGLGPPCFTETSAAAAIIAGVALCVQGMNQQLRGVLLTPQQLRSVLSNPALGTLATGQIGVMPDLQRIFASL